MICNNCKRPVPDDTEICQWCGENPKNTCVPSNSKESPVLGILALIFSALTMVFGLVFGIAGLIVYEDYYNRLHCKIGIYISITLLGVGLIALIVWMGIAKQL